MLLTAFFYKDCEHDKHGRRYGGDRGIVSLQIADRLATANKLNPVISLRNRPGEAIDHQSKYCHRTGCDCAYREYHINYRSLAVTCL